jgi:hypothetical protein
MRKVPMLAPALIAVIAVAGGCSAPGPESGPGANSTLAPAAAAAGDDAGLPTKGGDDGGLGTKGDDGGLGTKGDDGGLGTKGDDGGLGTNGDSGSGTEDAGTGGQDAGGMTTPDAGGGLGACFACAEQRGCKVPVQTCVNSPACMQEGSCDLACLTAPGAHFGGPDPRCVASCSSDWHATEELLAAVSCGFRVCPIECIRPLISCGGDAGAGRMEPVEPGCMEHVGPLPF